VRRILFSAAFVAIAVLAPKPLFAGTSEVAVRIDESGAVVVPVGINGNGPFAFLLDTGSTHSVISESLVERLGLQAVAKTSVLTSTGREWRRVVALNQTTIEDVRSPEKVLASIVPSTLLEDIARDIEGIIGQDFLFAFNYTLDYRRKRLLWNDSDSAVGEGIRLPLVAQGGRYLVRLTPVGTEPAVFLVPDSGASGFVAYERGGRTKLALTPAFGTTSVHSLSGGQSVRNMLLRELRIGSLTVKNQPIAVVPRDADDAIEGDGLLPLHVFSRVSFNVRDGYLLLNP
jgi:predicted aspartyl protease